jgi:hypothetical protein
MEAISLPATDAAFDAGPRAKIQRAITPAAIPGEAL